MDSAHSFELRAHNSPSILPRIALVLSRRRITPVRMQFDVDADPSCCSFEFVVHCDLATATRLRAQLARVVEVIDIDSRPMGPVLHVTEETGAAA